MKASIAQEIAKQVKVLPNDLQRRVLAYVETLNVSRQRGVPGTELVRFAGAISRSDLNRMSRAIASACEQVNSGEW
jgi:hypothetical protein